MGIVVDCIVVAIILLSVFLGYKKGLIALAVHLLAFIIAIAVTILLYKPVATFVVNVTAIDEGIENAIIEKVNEIMVEDENQELTSELIQSAKDGTLPDAAKDLSIAIVNVGVMIILYILIRIILKFVTALANFVAKAPLIKQLNEIGGLVYGLARGILIIYIALLLIGFVNQVYPNNAIHSNINNSYLTKLMYENNILNGLIK